ncbi:branched-chain amino acid transport system II carrier protein, partial [Pseudomonas sp. RTC3]|nr:branched-chain amino acid transport system II carrier protein [Pseudomonas sp. RTC3]
SVVYPIAITVVLLILIARFIPTKRIAQQVPLVIVTIESILSLITTQGWFKLPFIDNLPLKHYSLEWFPIAVIATIIGYTIS